MSHPQFPPLNRRMMSVAMRDARAIDQAFDEPVSIPPCPRWLDVACRAFIIAAGVVSVALVVSGGLL